MKVFHGHDEKAAGTGETVISVQENPENIKIRPGSNVSEWELMEERFRETLSSPGSTIEWSEGNAIYTRSVIIITVFPLVHIFFL